jgi:hypothetical protein
LFEIAIAAGSSFQGSAVDTWIPGNFFTGPGQVNGMATASAAWLIGDVGLYLDPNNTGVPPPWQMPDYALELAACCRYWQFLEMCIVAYSTGAGIVNGSSYSFPVIMRTTPALAQTSAGSGSNVNSAAFDSPTTRQARQVIVATAAGSFYMNNRIFAANARM